MTARPLWILRSGTERGAGKYIIHVAILKGEDPSNGGLFIALGSASQTEAIRFASRDLAAIVADGLDVRIVRLRRGQVS